MKWCLVSLPFHCGSNMLILTNEVLLSKFILDCKAILCQNGHFSKTYGPTNLDELGTWQASILFKNVGHSFFIPGYPMLTPLGLQYHVHSDKSMCSIKLSSKRENYHKLFKEKGLRPHIFILVEGWNNEIEGVAGLFGRQCCIYLTKEPQFEW